MSGTRWTPGPWRINKYGSIGAGNGGHEPIIANIEPLYGEDAKYGDHFDNLRLIAAAPELYAALHYAETVMMIVQPRSHTKEYLACLEQARTALRKARGEP